MPRMTHTGKLIWGLALLATSLAASAQSELLDLAGTRVAAQVEAFNPVFDITPADLIDVIVTEKGIVERPDKAKLARLMCRKRLH